MTPGQVAVPGLLRKYMAHSRSGALIIVFDSLPWARGGIHRIVDWTGALQVGHGFRKQQAV
ncbi:hypothetical protein N0V93_009557 [Gnomoniopsis smithogilvyi]|uniref:Uncharacterized protein n=1 Tax=Gnomoniopsis smithogilvyi TaxID=1191159 RepID=A0A9W8YJU5_9PEZI|nr:hypothetical protein N0V93_009557 [Gnomoniopsis smithogilvyi]